MKRPNVQSGDSCAHCLDDCDFVRYKKRVSKTRALMWKFIRREPIYFETTTSEQYGPIDGCKGSRNFCEFLYDANLTFVEKGVYNFFSSISLGIDMYENERSGGPGYPGLYSNLLIVHLIFKEPEMDKVDTR